MVEQAATPRAATTSPTSKSSALASKLFRIVMEMLLWLPLWLLLSASKGPVGKAGILLAAMAIFAIGLLLRSIPAAWRRILMIAVFLVFLAYCIVKDQRALPVMIWMAVLLWRGRYPKLGYLHYWLAFGVCCAAIMVTSLDEAWSDYRMPLILMGIGWMIVWFFSVNKSLIERAGLSELGERIVTKPVRQASRKYMLIYLAVGLLSIALTASYGQQLLTPKHSIAPDNSWIDPERFLQPPEKSPPEPDWTEMIKKDGKPSPVWDIVFWAMVGVAAIGAIWLARWIWNDRTWTLKGLLLALRTWFKREKGNGDELPYVEERRTLTKEPKRGPGLFDALFRRRNKGPQWEQLSNSEKVRRLYEEAVLEGMNQGYGFQAHLTPSETLEDLERWRSNRPYAGNDSRNRYWSWLFPIRETFAKLYEKAKYSTHDVPAREVEQLREGHPEIKK